MRVLLVAACALLATACATTTTRVSSTFHSHESASGAFIAGTLAPLGSFEYQVAPQYTANAMLRRRAAVNLDRGRITVDVARSILRVTDRTRTALDDAVAADRRGDIVRARVLLGEAKRALAEGQTTLEGGLK